MLKQLLLLFAVFSSSVIFASTPGEKTQTLKEKDQLEELSQAVFENNISIKSVDFRKQSVN